MSSTSWIQRPSQPFMVDGKVVLYTEAYVWSAMPYSKPMGVCGGVTGYWADPWTPT